MIDGLPPGPRLPALQMAQQTLRPGPWLEGCRRRYGDTFTVRTPGRRPPLVMLSDPADVRAVFTGDAEVLRAGAARDGLQPMFGDRSILLLDGAEHLRERRLMLPPFHGARMARYGELMAEVASREIARWPLGRPFDLQSRMQTITLDVILRAVFGMDEGAEMDAMRDAIQRLLGATASPLAYLVVLAPGLKRGPATWIFNRVLHAADALIFEQIARRRADPGLAERDDVLSLLLQARDEDGVPLTDRQLRDELVTLLLAGHETTATGLAWAFDALWRHPANLDRLTAECDAGDGDDYLETVLKETLRLRPPIPFVDRMLAGPFEVGGHRLPPGVVVAPSIYLVHRRDDLYPEPAAFRPERFLDDEAADTYTWLPFGGGIRRCLGASFAQFEMKVVLATVLRQARLGAASPRPETTRRRSIVLAPARGARAVMHERLT
jgi:cytochrome P450 family 135